MDILFLNVPDLNPTLIFFSSGWNKHQCEAWCYLREVASAKWSSC